MEAVASAKNPMGELSKGILKRCSNAPNGACPT
jgi:hypothetical protein